jgi:hypothetical protein
MYERVPGDSVVEYFVTFYSLKGAMGKYSQDSPNGRQALTHPHEGALAFVISERVGFPARDTSHTPPERLMCWSDERNATGMYYIDGEIFNRAQLISSAPDGRRIAANLDVSRFDLAVRTCFDMFMYFDPNKDHVIAS